MAIGKNLKTGDVFAEEYGTQLRGQMTLEQYQEQQNVAENKPTFDPSTGEIFENVNSAVVDFRAIKEA